MLVRKESFQIFVLCIDNKCSRTLIPQSSLGGLGDPLSKIGLQINRRFCSWGDCKPFRTQKRIATSLSVTEARRDTSSRGSRTVTLLLSEGVPGSNYLGRRGFEPPADD